jgi:hypothetical protein
MPTPTNPLKRLLAAGAKRGSAWGTAVALGAGDGMLIESDGGMERKQAYIPDKDLDAPFVQDGDLGPVEAVDFAPAFTMRYSPGALGTLIAQFMGTAGAPSTLGATSKKHTFQMADSIEGKFSTVVCERPGKIYEVASAKPYKLSFSIADSKLKGTIGLRGNTLIDNSAVNGATQIDALTYADRGNRVMFKHLAVKINAQTGADVAAETALELKGLAVDMERPIDAEIAAGASSILEPEDGPQPTAKIKLEFARSNTVNRAFFATFRGETEQKLLLLFTGDLIETTYYYSFALYFPRVRVISYQCPIGDVIGASIEMVAEEAAAAPTGMTDPRPYIELVNLRATDYLA